MTRPSIRGYCFTWVIKTPLESSGTLHGRSNPKRAVKKFNELHPDYPTFLYRDSWVLPYFGETQASDHECAEYVLSVYRQSRQILWDACGRGNILRYYDDQRMKYFTVCPDVDLLCKLTSGSPTSQELRNAFLYSNNELRSEIDFYWNRYATIKTSRTKTVRMLRVIFALENDLDPQFISNRYLTTEVFETLYTNVIQKNKKMTMRDIEISCTVIDGNFFQVMNNLSPSISTPAAPLLPPPKQSVLPARRCAFFSPTPITEPLISPQLNANPTDTAVLYTETESARHFFEPFFPVAQRPQFFFPYIVSSTTQWLESIQNGLGALLSEPESRPANQ